MGMAAGQARLLSITARLSDNEANGQALSYSKQRLADETEQLNTNYNNALAATKLQVLTGFNGSIANYSDISYNLMTGYETVACGKQYIVTDAKGKILVTDKQAKAFEAGNGDFNIFLAELGYTQADIDNCTDDEAKVKIHEAWDKYFTSIGKTFDDVEHEEGNPAIEYGYTSFGNNTLYSGYATYTYNGKTQAINYEGSTKEQRELYDYAVAITTQFYCNGNYNPASAPSCKALQIFIEPVEHDYFLNSPKVYENERLSTSLNWTLGAEWPSLSAIRTLSS